MYPSDGNDCPVVVSLSRFQFFQVVSGYDDDQSRESERKWKREDLGENEERVGGIKEKERR